jgi:hypothetical protein
MTLYSYVVKEDTGFAPNPFHGYCTVACCKAPIRKKAKEGDWIVGLTSKDKGNGIVFFMQVHRVLTFDQYWKEFKQKRPNLNAGIVAARGDNIYERREGFSYGYRQLRSMHSQPEPFGKSENEDNKRRDLESKNVLVAKKFAYFGSDPKPLPKSLWPLKIGRGYRCKFLSEVQEAFLQFVGEQKLGVHAPPKLWKGDGSWEDAACGIGAGTGC